MTRVLLLFFGIGLANLLFAQEIAGDWHGQLDIQGTKLRLILHLQQEEAGVSATLDSPDQGAKGIPLSEINYTAPVLTFSMKQAGFAYRGEWQEATGSFTGTFTQGGMSFPLTFGRETIQREKPVRPQEPQPPLPYRSEELTFANEKAGGIKLAGTLTLPEGKGPWPAAILISGSGPQNRDEELMGHKPFLIIADYLTRKGIAVLRYDDRGVGASEGDFKAATSADFASDVTAAIRALSQRKDIQAKKIGLIGHSEGGLIAPMVAAGHKEVAFVVMLAGPGVNGEKIILHQSALISAAEGVTPPLIQAQQDLAKGAFDMLRNNPDAEQAAKALRTYFQTEVPNLPEEVKAAFQPMDQAIEQQVKFLNTPWMRFFLSHEPLLDLSKVRCPMLILNGEKDLQVDAAQNIPPIEETLKKAKHQDYTIKVLPGLNHLFQHSETGSTSEYGNLTETFSPEALELMGSWIAKRFK